MASLRSLLMGLGAGAAAMYFYDPVRGNYRRSLCRDKMRHYGHEINEAFDVLGRDMSHRVTGLAYEITGPAEVNVSDEKLVARVRSQLGRVASHPGSIEVEADNGRVTLRGPIFADEVQPVVRTVKAVPGVQSVDNQLDVHQEAGNIPGLQGGRKSRPGNVPDLFQENWSPTTQALVTAGGAALLGSLLMGRRPPLLLAAGGLALAAMSGSNRSLSGMMGNLMGDSMSGMRKMPGMGGNRGTQQEINRPVREIMTENPACCTPDTSLQEVARMMRECNCGAIPVVEDTGSRRAVGIITDRDIAMRAIAEGKNPLDLKARECMSSPVASVRPDTTISQLMTTMEDAQIRRMVVVDENDRVIGIVAQADVALSAPRRQAGEVVREVSEPAAAHRAATT